MCYDECEKELLKQNHKIRALDDHNAKLKINALYKSHLPQDTIAPDFVDGLPYGTGSSRFTFIKDDAAPDVLSKWVLLVQFFGPGKFVSENQVVSIQHMPVH